MSVNEIIDAIEDSLKSGITQKSGLRKVVEKVNQAEPMVANHAGYDHRAARLMNEAQSAFQRAANEADAATRKLAGAIGLLDDGVERKNTAQTDAFDQQEDADEPDANSDRLQLNGAVSPLIDPDRLVPGGDAHDSLSVPQLAAATRDDLAVLRGFFEVDGTLYTAITVAPDRHCDAHELLFADEVDEAALEFERKGGYVGQHALIDYEGDGDLDEVILGNLVRFVVPQPDLPDDAGDEFLDADEEDDAPEASANVDEPDAVSGDGVADEHAEPEPAAA